MEWLWLGKTNEDRPQFGLDIPIRAMFVISVVTRLLKLEVAQTLCSGKMAGYIGIAALWLVLHRLAVVP